MTPVARITPPTVLKKRRARDADCFSSSASRGVLFGKRSPPYPEPNRVSRLRMMDDAIEAKREAGAWLN
jgi:hypothetical protein